MKTWMLGGLVAAVTACASGCSIKAGSSSDPSQFREPIPQSDDVLLKVPGSSAGASSASTASAFAVHPMGGANAGGGTVAGGGAGAQSNAQYYVLTRELTDGVDWGTAETIGLVWFVVQLPPTTTSANQAVWGPYRGDSLSPVSWRLTVTETAQDTYDYELEGRPAASSSDGDWKAVLTGHGYGKASTLHASGWFQWDADAQRALDPMYGGKDTGTTKVTYDVRGMPSRLHVEHTPTAVSEGSYVIDVTHETGGAGQVDVVAKSDTDGKGQLENVDMFSRWDTSGAGRSDADVSGGDVPTSIQTVHATECWDATFQRVYYTDSVGYQPTTGSPSACAFQQVITPQPH